MGNILVSGGYGGNTQKPFVMMESESIDDPIQLSPAEAREVALSLLDAADAAETDALMIRFLRDELKQGDDIVIATLRLFRDLRKKMDDT